MSKKVKSLILAAVAAVVLIGAFVALKFLLPEREDPTIDQNAYVLFDEYSTDATLESVTVDWGEEHFTIEKLSSYNYGIAELQDYIGNTTPYSSLLTSSYRVSTYTKVDDASNLTEFGLNQPQATITFVFDKATHVLHIGNINASQNGYYVMVDDSKDVYVLQGTTVGSFLVKETSFIDLQLTDGFDTSDQTAYPVFSYWNVERPDLEKGIYIRTLTKEEKKYSSDYGQNLKMTEPVDSLVLEDAVKTYMFGIFGVSAVECVDFKLTEDKLAQYGLDEPVAVLNTKFDNTEMTWTVGKFADEEQNLYYMTTSKQPNLVFTMQKGVLNWVKVDPSQMVSPVAVQPFIRDISKITVEIGGKKTVFTLKHEMDENNKNVTTVAADGKEIDTDMFKRYLQLLLYTSGEEIYYGDRVASSAALTIKYEYNNGSTPDIVKILKNGARYGVMEVNGHQNFTARLAYIDKLSTELGHLLSGEYVDTEW